MIYLLVLSLLSTPVGAKDFGVQGTVYPIAEHHPVEVIEEQLKDLDPTELETLFQQSIAEDNIFEPTKGWKPTTQPRRFSYDPTYTVSADIKDHKGYVLFKKGERVNPLDIMPIEKTLLFIDGQEEEQIQWVLASFPQDSKVMLVAGSPKTLMKRYARSFYFDQSAHLIKTFGITQIPAVVRIENGEVWVEEVKLGGLDDV